MRFKYTAKKPSRDQLWGMSPSQFKTMLKRRGFKVDRDFFKLGAMAKQGKPGDYLMRGIEGELYICDGPIFEKTYDFL